MPCPVAITVYWPDYFLQLEPLHCYTELGFYFLVNFLFPVAFDNLLVLLIWMTLKVFLSFLIWIRNVVAIILNLLYKRVALDADTHP